MRDGLAVIAVFLLLAVLIGASYTMHHSLQETVDNVVVTGKERIVQTDGDGRASSKYLIFTNKETFENTDSFFAWKFDSSDVYGKLEKGDVCRFRVVGLRVKFLSWYRNILEATCKKA